ncbi:MAG: PDZ domain-containing protein [Acidobacteriota bacterium]
MKLVWRIVMSAAIPAVIAAPAAAQVDARMFRYPDVSASQIAFVYAGDVWTVPKAGGVAMRLSSPAGEESFPRFSPDGSRIAYSANYDGNTDVYVVPSMGGEPVRLTHHPTDDRVIDWTPDGKRVLFVSSRESGRQRYSQFYTVPVTGGLPAKLPIPYGEFAAYSADGQSLAYMPQSRDFRTWKRYRGGWAPDIWTFDLKTMASVNVTKHDANDAHPMWHGASMYFLSDRAPSGRYNIWAIDKPGAAPRQVTTFTDIDITFPAAGPDDIVFQAGGKLYRLAFAGEKLSEVPAKVVTDEITVKPKAVKVDALVTAASISPTGKRGVFQARGDLFTVPAENGPVLNLSRSSGVAERYPSWSPDGKTLAYWSDRSGEYELTMRPADGSGTERTLTKLGPGYRYRPHWSPDSKKVAFIDERLRVRIADVATGQLTEVSSSPVWMGHGALEAFRPAWSADSRWLAFNHPLSGPQEVVFLYDTTTAKRVQVTSGYFSDAQPVFDPEGKYLFYLSNRNFEPVYGDFDNGWTYPNSTQIVAVPLKADTPSPLAPKNDVEEPKKDEAKDKAEAKPAAADPAKAGASQAADAAKKEEPKKDEGPKPVEIDLEGFESRAIILPPKAGNYTDLFAAKGKVIYRRLPRSGSGDEKRPIVYFDLAEREEKTVLDDAQGFELSSDGNKLLVTSNRRFAIVELKSGQKMDKPMRTGEMESVVDPRAEWKQMFADAYRFERDYFYDANMHGVNWAAIRDKYAKILDGAVTRWDVNFVLGEFIAELNASHSYRGGGDTERTAARGVGMLGVDWELADGAYRVKHIVRGGPWDVDVRSPLAEPGLGVKEGEYVLAVNGMPLDASKDPWAAFQGLANATVSLTVNAKPTAAGARQVLVKTIDDETELRFREWIEARRRRVDEATGGKIGYIYVQSTGVGAQSELVRQFMAQFRKDGLIIDERFNSGGQIPDRFIELLNRPMLAYWAVRAGEDWQWPPVAHAGPKAMLINGWSGSGGDAFPFYFREAKLGPLVGKRTWGGLIGVSGAPGIVDGGGLTVPTFRMYDVRGKWFAEGHGVEPDIEVEDDPTQLAKGTDPQLERAIQEVQRLLKERPATKPARPAYEKR